MSAQAGIYYSDLRPVPRDVIDVLRHFNTALGPDRTGLYTADGIAVLSFASHFDQLSQQERQPLVSSQGSVLTWDGRLDNRDDFIVRLQTDLFEDVTDANLVGLALAKWEDDALRDIIGDWSLVYCDARTHVLLLARDYVGNRPLYYCSRAGCFVWSTTIEPIVEIAGLADEINECYIAGCLTHQNLGDETCYRHIHSVPCGQALRVRPDCSFSVSRFFQLASDTVRHLTKTQYEEHYRNLFTQAVKVRLRAKKPVWLTLSGGYDSSAVACIATALVRAGEVDAPSIQPISSISPSSPEDDESCFIESVERFCRVSSVRNYFRLHLRADRDAYDRFPLAGEQYVPSPTAVANGAGSHVLMTGEFGDAVTNSISTPELFREHFRAGRWLRFVTDALQYCRATRDTFVTFLRLLPDSSQAEATRLQDLAVVVGLRPDLVRRLLMPRPTVAEPAAQPRDMSRAVLQGLPLYVAAGGSSAGYESHALRVTHPFMHRPLLEFIVSVPAEIAWSPEHPRAFAIGALRDVLPEAILRRGTKCQFASLMKRDLIPVIERRISIIDQWLLVRDGYTDRQALTRCLRGFVNGTLLDTVLAIDIIRTEMLLQRLQARKLQPPVSSVSSRLATAQSMSAC